VITTVVNYMIE